MIKDVEHLKAELEQLLFDSRDIFADGAIYVPKAWISQGVPRLDSECPLLRYRERRLVEPYRRVRKAGHFNVGIPHEFPELISAAGTDAGVIYIVADRKRRAGLGLEDPGQFPVSQ